MIFARSTIDEAFEEFREFGFFGFHSARALEEGIKDKERAELGTWMIKSWQGTQRFDLYLAMAFVFGA